MSAVSAERPPHLWMVAPRVWVCVLCRQQWAAVDPYQPCTGAPPFVSDLIRQGEQQAGVTIADFYDQQA